MSHFVVGTIISKKAADVLDKQLTADAFQTAMEALVAEVLAPYDEAIDVAPYKKDCYCKSSNLRAYVDTHQKIHLNDLRESFKKEHPEFIAREYGDEEVDAAWAKHIQPYHDECKQLEAEGLTAKADAPTPDCEECHGTGQRDTTYNPKSKWDWYQIGGRWDGLVHGKEEKEARETEGGYNFSGVHTVASQNAIGVRQLLARTDFSDVVPFALVSRDGWCEKGEMGWFGMVSNKKDKDVWHEQARQFLTKHIDDLIIYVDCHI